METKQTEWKYWIWKASIHSLSDALWKCGDDDYGIGDSGGGATIIILHRKNTAHNKASRRRGVSENWHCY